MSVDIKQLARKNLSKHLIADYKPFTMVDGEGFRCSLYVSGCIFNCKGCYNKTIQAFGVGRPYTQALEDTIIRDLSFDYVQGLTLLGGEPFLNTDTCLKIVRRVREEFGNKKDIWSWTGYTYNELLESIACNTLNSKKQKELLDLIDVLVDGRYVDELKDKTGRLKYRGSWNQQIIDVPKTQASGSIILWKDNYNEVLIDG